jgi:hypothetical protein
MTGFSRYAMIVITLALTPLSDIRAQSLSGVGIGSDKSALNQLGVSPTSSQALGPHTAVKFALPGGNSLSATFLRASGKIVYVETDWGGQGAGAYSDFEGFKFGETTLDDVRTRFGHNGLMFGERPAVTIMDDGTLALLNSYEIAGRSEIATFVTSISPAEMEALQATNGSTKLAELVGPRAKLTSLILAEREYADTIWGANKTFDAGYAPISWGPASAKTIEASAKVDNGYDVSDIYTGGTKYPDFGVRDAAFKTFRTRVRSGMKAGPSFAGEYSVIQIGCGSGCSFVVVASNRTGEAFNFPRGGEENMYLALKYRLSSRLLTAQWASHDDDKCYVERFEFTGADWKPLFKDAVGNLEACYKPIEENL